MSKSTITGIYEKRQFLDPNTKESVSYDAYCLVSVVDGERFELRLGNLSQAEKIAFRMLLSGEPEGELQTGTARATEEEKEAFNANIKKEESQTEDWLDTLKD